MAADRIFWDLVDQGLVEVCCEAACIDALNDTPNIDIQEFLDEAEEYGWIYVDSEDGDWRTNDQLKSYFGEMV